MMKDISKLKYYVLFTRWPNFNVICFHLTKIHQNVVLFFLIQLFYKTGVLEVHIRILNIWIQVQEKGEKNFSNLKCILKINRTSTPELHWSTTEKSNGSGQVIGLFQLKLSVVATSERQLFTYNTLNNLGLFLSRTIRTDLLDFINWQVAQAEDVSTLDQDECTNFLSECGLAVIIKPNL